MKQWKLAGLIAALMLVGMRTASAVPVVDGTITGTEWDAFLLGGTDPNESGAGTNITDNWDISGAKIFRDNDGAGSDDWYFLMTTYAAPTFSHGPGGFATEEAFFVFALDFNSDGDTDDAVDRTIWFNELNGGEVNVFDGTGASLGSGTGALGSVIEFSADESLFPNDNSLQVFGRLDNSGDEPDDRIPNEGFFRPPVVPEPTSMILFGVGLLGGVARKKLGLF